MTRPPCSSRAATPDARRRPPRCCVTTPATASRCCPAGRNPPTRCTLRCALSWPSVGLEPEQQPKRFDAAMVQAADVVVTMGCGEECPVLPSSTYLDWEVEDPHGQPMNGCARSSTTSTSG